MDEPLKLEGDLRSSEVFHPADRFTTNGKVHYFGGEYEKAIDNFKKALDSCKPFSGSNLYAANLKYLAMTYTKTGEYQSAKKYYEEVLRILQTSPGTDHVNFAQTLNDYAWLCYSTKQYEKARINFEKAQKSFKESLGPDHPDLASCLENLARTCIKTGEYAKAKESIEKALKIRKKLKGHDHEDVAKALKIRGLLCYSTGKYDKAEEFYEEALKVFKKLRVPDHVDVADCLNNLGLLYYTTGKYKKAKKCLKKREETCKNTLGPYHDDVAETLENLVMVYGKTGEYEEANKCLEKAKEIRKKAKEIRKRDQVAEYLKNDTRLSDDEIVYLSNKIGGNYDTLALLAGMSDHPNNVRDDNFNYPGPVKKAREILRCINEDKTFSRQQLANHLEKMGLGKLAGELLSGEFRNPDSEKTKEYKKAEKCLEKAPEIHEKAPEIRKQAQNDPGEDGTKLSPIELDELSQKIGGKYDRRHDYFQFPSPESNAAAILKMINIRPNFSRKELADHLKKIGHGKSADDALRGRFR